MNIAIFGGTFDPIHNAHLFIAKMARDCFHLSRVLLIPASNPPHKLDFRRESYEHRYRMVELACAEIPGLEASRLEAGTRTSYSIDTIRQVRGTISETDRLYFLIGADAFAEVRTWHRWREVIAEVDFIVVARPGHEYEVPSGARVHRLAFVALAVSSSEIRAALAAGHRSAELPQAVFDYIRANGLYGFGSRSGGASG